MSKTLTLLLLPVLASTAQAQLDILLNPGSTSPDVEPRLVELGHHVTVSNPSTWGAGFDYSPYDVVAFQYQTLGNGNPASIPHLVAAVDAGTVGVVFFRAHGSEETAVALGLTGGSDLWWQTASALSVLDNSHCITAPLDTTTYDLGYTFMSRVDDPAAGTRVLASGPMGPALVVHDTRRAVIAPFYGHPTGYDGETSVGLMLTERCLQWAAGGDCTGESYCGANANSTGVPAAISAAGSNIIADSVLSLTAAPVPNDFFVFCYAPLRTEVPFGNGFLCIDGGVAHLSPPGRASGNVATRSVDASALGIVPGVLHFQCWYRDPTAGGETFNTSDAISVTFVP